MDTVDGGLMHFGDAILQRVQSGLMISSSGHFLLIEALLGVTFPMVAIMYMAGNKKWHEYSSPCDGDELKWY